jgi:hypothetical protein
LTSSQDEAAAKAEEAAAKLLSPETLAEVNRYLSEAAESGELEEKVTVNSATGAFGATSGSGGVPTTKTGMGPQLAVGNFGIEAEFVSVMCDDHCLLTRLSGSKYLSFSPGPETISQPRCTQATCAL